MKPLRNKEKATETPAKTVPTEVKQYYQAEKQDRLGAAWLLSIATFVATVIVVLGLFFAGRWAYRSFNKDESKQPATPISKNDNKPAETKQPANNPTTPTPAPAAPQPQPAPANNPAPAAAPAASQPSPQPAMPRTGPEDMVE